MADVTVSLYPYDGAIQETAKAAQIALGIIGKIVDKTDAATISKLMQLHYENEKAWHDMFAGVRAMMSQIGQAGEPHA